MRDISDFNKDQLQDYLKSNEDGVAFVELDMRKTIDKLRAQVVKLQATPAATPKEPENPSATHIKNKGTGFIFPFSTLLQAHLGDNGSLCDENGDPA